MSGIFGALGISAVLYVGMAMVLIQHNEESEPKLAVLRKAIADAMAEHVRRHIANGRGTGHPSHHGAADRNKRCDHCIYLHLPISPKLTTNPTECASYPKVPKDQSDF